MFHEYDPNGYACDNDNYTDDDDDETNPVGPIIAAIQK